MPAGVHAPMFKSFFLGGFECATGFNREGHWIDMVSATWHDHHADDDYRRRLQALSAQLQEGIDAERTRVALQAVAEAHGVSLATAAYAWVLRHPSHPHLVTGTGRRTGLQEAVTATQLHLSVQQWTRIWRASMGHDVA